MRRPDGCGRSHLRKTFGPNPGSRGDAARSPDRGGTIVVAGLVSGAAVLTVAIEGIFAAAGILDQYNVLFDADPGEYLEHFGDGVEVLARHPLVFLIGVVSTVMGNMVEAVTGIAATTIRHSLAVLVVPTVNGIRAGATWLLFLRLGFSRSRAALAVVISFGALNSLTIGSVPESFPISACILTLAALLAIGQEGSTFRSAARWVALGVASAGVTVTNPIAVLLLLFASRLRRASWMRALHESVTVGTAILVITLAVVFAAASLSGASMPRVSDVVANIVPPERRPENPAQALMLAFSLTLVTPIVPDKASLLIPPEEQGRYPAMFTYRDTISRRPGLWMWAACWLLFLAYGARAGLRDDALQPLVTASIGILVFNGGLHLAFYGRDLFLYSLHWQLPQLLLCAALWRGDRWPSRLAPAVLAVLTASTGLTCFWWIVQCL